MGLAGKLRAARPLHAARKTRPLHIERERQRQREKQGAGGTRTGNKDSGLNPERGRETEVNLAFF